jgi:hypothetical protein
MQRRGICFQRAKLYSLYWRRIQRACGKKLVILALRYFSAAAGDALMRMKAACTAPILDTDAYLKLERSWFYGVA